MNPVCDGRRNEQSGPSPAVTDGPSRDAGLPFDAKPSIQARGRIHETLPAAPGKPVRVEHEYVRHGALALLAGLDVQSAST